MEPSSHQQPSQHPAYQPSPAPATYNYNKPRYTGFYLTMLILGTIGGVISALALLSGLFSLNEMLKYSSAYSIQVIVQYIISLVSIAGIVFLWLKKPIGLYLTLGSLAASLIMSVIAFFTLDAQIDASIATVPADQVELTRQFLPSFIIAVNSIAIVMTILVSVLWWFAWKSQIKSDKQQ